MRPCRTSFIGNSADLGSPLVLGRGLGLQKVQTAPCLSSTHIAAIKHADQSRRPPLLEGRKIRRQHDPSYRNHTLRSRFAEVVTVWWPLVGGDNRPFTHRRKRWSRHCLSRGIPQMAYWLTPPSRAIFILSVLLAVLALLVRYAHVAIPIVSAHSFETPAHRVSALARREFCFADSDVERSGRLAKCSIAASLRRAVLLVDPFAAPCGAQRQRPFRARSTLGIVAVADHDHLRRVASAFSHSSHVFILLPVQAFSALSVEWSGYEGFHRGFSLGGWRKE
jgi:hypothetical protein